MRKVWLLAAVVAFSGTTVGLAVAQTRTEPSQAPASKVDSPALYKSEPGTWDVKVIDESWKDEARNRMLPVRIYLPQAKEGAAGDEKLPVIVFSHGLGGSGVNYAYFGRHLASHGYLVLAPTHPGSDTDQAKEWIKSHGTLLGAPAAEDRDKEPRGDRPRERLRERIRERRDGEPVEKGPEPGAGMMPGVTGEGGWLLTTVNEPDNLKNRPRDISFVLDHVAKHSILGPLADLTRVGVAGHSFGAYTAMAIGGMLVDLPIDQGGKAQSFADPRVRAVLPMSPEGTGTMGISAGAWSKFAVPALFLTGTRDYGAGPRSAAWRREAFDAATGVDRALVTLENAGHMTFANPGEKSAQQAANRLGMGLLMLAQNDAKKQAEHIALVDSLSTMFFDAYVRGDAAATRQLQTFCASKRADCTAEFIPAAKSEPAEKKQP